MILNLLKNRHKILGINERNINYVRKYNPRSAREIADNKITTKNVLKEADIPTTKILAVIKNRKDLDAFDFNSVSSSFVIKPVNGTEGSGIELIYNRDKKGNFILPYAHKMSESEMRGHIVNILEGRYSHNYAPDHALIEERVKPHKKFRAYVYRGTPDVRIITFRTIPVMAMVRWPTRESEGKANASKGAVASGIDLATGTTTHSMQEKKNGKIYIVEYIAKTQLRYSGFKIPYWDKILGYSVKASQIAGLGFCAVDFLIDRELGPLVVELNARPGLRIQIANQDGLKWRLEQIKYLHAKSLAHAVRLGKDLFGGEVEEEIEAIAGKKIISLIQPVKFYSKSGKKNTVVKTKVDTGADYSSIDMHLAEELGYKDAIEHLRSFNIPQHLPKEISAEDVREKYYDKLVSHPDIVDAMVIVSSNGRSYRIVIELQCKIDEKIFTLHATIADRSNLQFPALIGKKDLKDFLIDPAKTNLNIWEKY